MLDTAPALAHLTPGSRLSTNLSPYPDWFFQLPASPRCSRRSDSLLLGPSNFRLHSHTFKQLQIPSAATRSLARNRPLASVVSPYSGAFVQRTGARFPFILVMCLSSVIGQMALLGIFRGGNIWSVPGSHSLYPCGFFAHEKPSRRPKRSRELAITLMLLHETKKRETPRRLQLGISCEW